MRNSHGIRFNGNDFEFLRTFRIRVSWAFLDDIEHSVINDLMGCRNVFENHVIPTMHVVSRVAVPDAAQPLIVP